MPIIKSTATLALTALTLLAASAAQAASTTETCGPVVSSVVKTETEITNNGNTFFTQVPGATVGVSVAVGTSRCIKVRFTAATKCTSFSFPGGVCFVRPLISNVPFFPATPGGTPFNGGASFRETANAFQWVRRVGPGNYTIVLQSRVNDPSIDFQIDDWTLEVEVTE